VGVKLPLALLGAALAVALAVVAGAWLVPDDESDQAIERAATRLPGPPVREDPDPRELIVRVAPGGQLALREGPNGRILSRIGDRTEFGSPQVLSPVELYRGWIAVRHTSLGNDGVAWIEARRAPLVYAGRLVRLEVDLSRRELRVFSNDHLRRRMRVAIGAPDTPTPPGEYYVTDKLPGVRFGPYYGCCILALSGHQPNLPQGWSGGDRLAIHGSPTATWGKAVSNGCFHASRRNLRYLMKTVPLGTEVVVHA
jgi:L,D-transpeptidase catalytic domain